MYLNDIEMAKKLQQEEFEGRLRDSSEKGNKPSSLIDPTWELIDPNPNIYSLFQAFDKKFFGSTLGIVEVKWSPRMYSCAGICTYKGRGGCVVSLSLPLLKLRPRKDLIETLLHEMIHAYLFLHHRDRDRDGHGPKFHAHMHRINAEAGTHITVYHTFHDEVRHYKTHWWRCDGPCRFRKPFFGLVKRAMNRAPGPSDNWYSQHQMTCGGSFIKIQEPEGFKSRKRKVGQTQTDPKKIAAPPSPKKVPASGMDIKKYLVDSNGSKISSTTASTNLPKVRTQPSTSNIKGFPNGQGGAGIGTINGTKNIHGFETTMRPAVVAGSFKSNKGGTLVQNPKTTSGSNTNRNGSVSVYGGSGPVQPFSGTGHLLASPGTTIDRTTSKLLSLYPPPPKKYKKLDNFDKPIENQESVSKTTKNTVPCPVCGVDVNCDEVNTHLDSCVQMDFSYEPINSQNLPPSPSKDQFTHCPICGKNVFIKKINEHVDACIQADPSSFVDLTIDNPSTSSGFTSNPPSPTKGLFASCPVCDKKVFKTKMDEHLDQCLSLDSIMDSSNQGIVTGYDTDRAGTSDDSDVEPTDARCPCCDKRFSVDAINAHLDGCLQSLNFD